LVWASVSAGSSFAQTEEILRVANIPFISKAVYYKHESMMDPTLQSLLTEYIKKAGEEELRIATEKGQLDADGNGCIAVAVDGSWAKDGYESNSGMVVIYGLATGKLLFLTVRNKYCSICASGKKHSENSICFLNHKGSSGSMETLGILAGFNESVCMHKLKYTKYVSDNDSSVAKILREQAPYETEKSDCMVHQMRSFLKSINAVSIEGWIE
jgi:hypothetical protein